MNWPPHRFHGKAEAPKDCVHCPLPESNPLHVKPVDAEDAMLGAGRRLDVSKLVRVDVRPLHDFMRIQALEDELQVTDRLLEERNRLLDLFECPAHGKGCVPHAIATVRAALARPHVPETAAAADVRARTSLVAGIVTGFLAGAALVSLVLLITGGPTP